MYRYIICYLQSEVIAKCGCIDPLFAITDSMWMSNRIPFCHNVGILNAHKMDMLDEKERLETLLHNVGTIFDQLYEVLIFNKAVYAAFSCWRYVSRGQL